MFVAGPTGTPGVFIFFCSRFSPRDLSHRARLIVSVDFVFDTPWFIRFCP